jgi:hypothetical protein
MSDYKGRVICPKCGYHKFGINSWETYYSVVCADESCGYKMGELDRGYLTEVLETVP